MADNEEKKSGLDQATRLVSENFARSINRRGFLKRASQAAFAGVLALATGHALAGRAGATRGPKPPDPTPQCSPPGPYCNLNGVNEPNGCHGAHCFQHRYNGQVLQCHTVTYWYQAGCWTTASGGGYWTCCDCGCGTPEVTTCGCAQFSTAPQPQPDRVGGNKLN